MRTLSWATLAMLALTAALVTSCSGVEVFGTRVDGGGNPGGSAAPTKVTLLLDWTPNTNHTGIYVAQSKGWYKEAGIDLSIIEPSGTSATQIVGAGSADFGITVAESLLPARSKGVPVVSIATILPSNDSSLMAVDTSITRPRDLAGKKYGGYGGELERELITKLVACDGGDASKVSFVDVGNVDFVTSMDDKRFDFVWVFEGWDAIRAREVLGRKVSTIKFADYLKCIPDWYTPLFIASEQTIKERPELVRKFLAATARGYDFAAKQPKDGADLLTAAVPELDKKLVGASAAYLGPKYIKGGAQWGQQDPAVWAAFEAFLRSATLLTAPVDTSKTFTNEFLPK